MDEDDVVERILVSDDEGEFISLFTSPRGKFWSDYALPSICFTNAVKCATALLERKTDLRVKINHYVLHGYYPLHLAAWKLFPGLVKLFLLHGARTDLICKDFVRKELIQKTPLSIALQSARRMDCLNGWTPGQSSIFKLIIRLCLPEMHDALDTIEPLALVTDTWELQIMAKDFALEGKLHEFALLLMVARERLLDPIIIVSRMEKPIRPTPSYSIPIIQYINCELDLLIEEVYKSFGNDTHNITPNHKKMMKMLNSATLLLEVFERASDDIKMLKENLVKGVPISLATKHFYAGLSEAGFFLKPSDYDLRHVSCTRKPAVMATEHSECGTQQLRFGLFSQLKKTAPRMHDNVVPFSKPLRRGIKTLPSDKCSIHTNQVSAILDVQVKKGTKAIEQV